MTGRKATTVSSALSSVSAAGVALYGPLVLDGPSYGVLAMVVMFSMFAATAMNSLVAEVLLTMPPPEVQTHLADADRTAVALAGSTAGLGATAYLVLSSLEAGPSAAVVGNCAVAVPLIFLLTHRRTTFFALRRPDRAVRLDLVWCLTWVVVLVVLSGTEVGPPATATSLALVWASAAGLACAVTSGAVARSGGPRASARRWLNSWGRYGSQLSAGELTYALSANASVALVAGTVGLTQAGGLRLAQSAFGMGRVAFNAARMYYLPRVAETGGRHPGPALALSLWLALVPLVSYLLLSGLLSLAPGAIDVDIAESVRQVLLPVGAASLAAALLQGPLIGLRAARAGRSILILRGAGAVSLIALPTLALARGGGLQEAAWALALAETVMVAAAWALLLRLRR